MNGNHFLQLVTAFSNKNNGFKNIFSDISGRYTTDIALINSLWTEIEKNYNLKTDIITILYIWKI